MDKNVKRIPVTHHRGVEYGCYELTDWKAMLAILPYVESFEDFKLKCSPPFGLSKCVGSVKGEELPLTEEQQKLLKGGRFLLYTTE